MTVWRFSSRQQRLEHVFLREKLRDAKRYLRIAGYFRSSLFELAHEELSRIDDVRIVCNSDLDPTDLDVAREAHRAAALKEKWNEAPAVLEGVLHRERYRRLHEVLVRGNVKVRVVPRTRFPLLHGKAGVIESRSGTRTSFLGSLNETREGWAENYELLWEDDSDEAICWVEEEFEALWSQGVPLPDAIVDEIDRCSRREEVPSVQEIEPGTVAAAAMAESPMYVRGETLMPWQRAFVTMVEDHRLRHGKARFLLADEVGLGKTLSLGTSALVTCLLNDGPVLVLCPATLTQQWQIELKDRLGVPSAVWTANKSWLDPEGHAIRTRGPEDIVRCPFQIGIVSTGLIVQLTPERDALLGQRFGTVILDEAHRARRSTGIGSDVGRPNNLLAFMLAAAARATHVLLGTATPFQTSPSELWDLLEVLAQGAPHVLGGRTSMWRDLHRVLPLLKGEVRGAGAADVWPLLRDPLPPRLEGAVFDHVRSDLGLADDETTTVRPWADLRPDTQDEVLRKSESTVSGLTFWQRHNPVVRHTVLRRRALLEQKGLLAAISVDVHPIQADETPELRGLAVAVPASVEAAYAEALEFTRLLGRRSGVSGFLRTLMLHRISSCVASGLRTAERLLRQEAFERDDSASNERIGDLTVDERACLERLTDRLRATSEDPKLAVAMHYLLGNRRWLEAGCILFTQYYDTAEWVASQLALRLLDEPLALYAGADKSRVFRGQLRASVAREQIKHAVRNREIRLVVATDAASEGLNLQTLGTLVNLDLPWNPARLEQRLGRIRRVGQARDSVSMLNLVYAGTIDERIHERLSSRLRERYALFGSLPDVIDDGWIDDIEAVEQRLAELIEKPTRRAMFDFRYAETIDPRDEPWERCGRVLARVDICEWMSRGW